jgi:hypothetical protein
MAVRAATRMADEQAESQRYPYEEDPDGLDDHVQQLLDISMRDGLVHVPTLAQRVVEEFLVMGPLHVKDAQPPENIRKVKVGERQEVWLRFDTYRDDEGYMALDVVEAPKSDAALLAAMTAFMVEPVERERLEQALAFRYSEAWPTLAKQYETLRKRAMEGQDLSTAESTLLLKARTQLERNAKQLQPLRYVVNLLSYYRPEISECSRQEQEEYVWKALDYVDDFVRSLRNLQGFLEYGVPNRRLSPVVKQPQRNVRAAVFHDVDGLSYRAIGERMNVPDPPDFDVKRDHQTVRKMVLNGRRVLEGALSGTTAAVGDTGWDWMPVRRAKPCEP